MAMVIGSGPQSQRTRQPYLGWIVAALAATMHNGDARMVASSALARQYYERGHESRSIRCPTHARDLAERTLARHHACQCGGGHRAHAFPAVATGCLGVSHSAATDEGRIPNAG